MGSVFSLFSYPDSRIVQTVNGKVQGRRLIYNEEKEVDAFQGIPFAKPPVGELRFKRPVPPDSWDGIKTTKAFGHRAIQANITFLDNYYKGSASEDCLTLNVFTPVWTAPEEGFPVLVYIHGGGFCMETAISVGDVNICQHLVTKDIVVVTLQYRLGYLGFFYTGDEACTPNIGLWDQIEGLKWINQNIAAFGGNPNNVTIFGQSAGGCSVDMLRLSPKANNLFHKCIPMAGNASAHWAFHNDNKTQCQWKADNLLGMKSESSHEMIRRLRSLPANAFSISLFTQGNQNKDNPIEVGPVIDGDIFPFSINELRRMAPPMPVMTGVTKMEALLFLMDSKPERSTLHKFISLSVPEGVPDVEKTREEFTKEYIDLDSHPNDDLDVLRATVNVYSDYFMNGPTLRLTQETNAVQEKDAPIWLYTWDHYNPKSWGILRFFMQFLESSHCTELSYIFGIGTIGSFNLNNDDKILLEMFSSCFTNFAKYGNPNGPSTDSTFLPMKWEPVTSEHPERHFNFSLNSEQRHVYFGGRADKVVKFKDMKKKSHI